MLPLHPRSETDCKDKESKSHQLESN